MNKTACRTKQTLQNSTTSLVLFLIQVFVSFYSRKRFLYKLGDEFLGVNTTIGNILSFLNLAGLGIGIAMATSLYHLCKYAQGISLVTCSKSIDKYYIKEKSLFNRQNQTTFCT